MTKKRLFGCITAILVLISMFSGCTNKNIADKFEVPQYEDDKTITIGAWTSGWIFDLQGTMKPEYWEMYELPGTLQADGKISNITTGGGTGAVILSASKHKEEAWEFISCVDDACI